MYDEIYECLKRLGKLRIWTEIQILTLEFVKKAYTEVREGKKKTTEPYIFFLYKLIWKERKLKYIYKIYISARQSLSTANEVAEEQWFR